MLTTIKMIKQLYLHPQRGAKIFEIYDLTSCLYRSLAGPRFRVLKASTMQQIFNRMTDLELPASP